MKMLVCGGRDFKDRAMLFEVLDRYLVSRDVTDIIHGAARGTDALAHQWAYERQIRIWPFPADWKGNGRAAGPIRNQRMLDEGRPDFVVAFPGGKGTADMIKRARKVGLEIRTHGQ